MPRAQRDARCVLFSEPCGKKWEMVGRAREFRPDNLRAYHNVSTSRVIHTKAAKISEQSTPCLISAPSYPICGIFQQPRRWSEAYHCAVIHKRMGSTSATSNECVYGYQLSLRRVCAEFPDALAVAHGTYVEYERVRLCFAESSLGRLHHSSSPHIEPSMPARPLAAVADL